MAEMEWEFNESSDQNDGQFMATGKVINFLRGHLARGEVDQAVSLYESCAQNVGDSVWAEFEGASVQMKKAIANLFYRARDYKRSAAACERLGEWIAAGRSYEAAYDNARAAQCYLKGDDKERAAAVIEKSGDYRKAAEMYYASGDLLASAAALERGGDIIGAAQLAIRTNDMRRAAQLLATVQQNDPRFLQAVGLLSDVLVKLDRRDLAIQRLAAVVPRGSRIQDKFTVELAYRLGRLMWEAGQPEQAKHAFEQVRTFDPRYKDVADCLEAITRGSSQAHTVSDPFIPVASTASGPVPSSSVKSKTQPPQARDAPAQAHASDPFAALDGNPFAPKAQAAQATQPIAPAGHGNPPSPASTVPFGFVTRMEGYDVLKKLPIFQDLSLDEMKAFYGICEQVFYPKGDIIIEQGKRGEALIIVREGSLTVSKVENGREATLATLPAGNYVGEMSLIDDAPTSARVTAAESVKALRIRRDRFEQFLFANDRIALRVYRTFVKTISARLRDTNAQMVGRR
jgi:tetratricopeptide (TPR) repeat protein